MKKGVIILILILLILSIIIVLNIVSNFGDFKTYDDETGDYLSFSSMIGPKGQYNPIFDTNKFPNLIIEYTTPDNVRERNRYPMISIKNKNNIEIVNTDVLLNSPETYLKLISNSGNPIVPGSKVKYIFMGLNEVFNEEMIFNEQYSIGIKLDTKSEYIYKNITFFSQPLGDLIVDEANYKPIVYVL
jgi:hypothetical protein